MQRESSLEEGYPNDSQSDAELYFEPEDEPLSLPDSGLVEFGAVDPETSTIEPSEPASSEDAVPAPALLE